MVIWLSFVYNIDKTSKQLTYIALLHSVTRNEDKRSQKKEIEVKKYIMCNTCMLCLIYYTCVMFIMYFCNKNYCNPIIYKKHGDIQIDSI